jgi:peptide-methionine (R)-S-oxide reductase
MPSWQAAFSLECYIASAMIKNPDRRLFLGLLGTSAVAGICLFAAGRGTAAVFEIRYSPAEWRRRLGQERYHILREAGTERPFTSALLKEKRKGVYACAGCNLPLFSSAAKYDSGTGWPSFWKALPNAVTHGSAPALAMFGTEEHCRRCGGHLGHIFDDGPPPTGKRHCINGLSLSFRPA